jgi:hypothetical protein
MSRSPVTIFVLTLLCFGSIARAQVTNTAMTIADAFLLTGSTNYEGGADLTGLNFGAAGTLAIAPASSAKGEFQSVIKFDLAAGVALFNATYGSNNWSVTGISLELTSKHQRRPIRHRMAGRRQLGGRDGRSIKSYDRRRDLQFAASAARRRARGALHEPLRAARQQLPCHLAAAAHGQSPGRHCRRR